VILLCAARDHAQALHDTYRIQFYHAYLNNACQAIERYDLNVKRIFAWTFLDNFEWCALAG
jgi:beta-glucosidase/6-phospho-beta-glucosidase/beta-galactosidase